MISNKAAAGFGTVGLYASLAVTTAVGISYGTDHASFFGLGVVAAILVEGTRHG